MRRSVVVFLFLMIGTLPAKGQVTTYCCDAAAEAQYLADLANVAAPVAVLAESFEGAPWSPLAVSVTNNGLTWSRAGYYVATSVGGGDVHDGTYLFYTRDASGLHPVPDGFTVTSDGANLYGFGGWYRGQGTPSKIGFTVDGVAGRVDFTGAEATVDNWKFLGFIDTTAFTSVDVRTVDEAGNETTIFFSDDFSIGRVAGATAPGDHDGDGKADVLLRNNASGQNWMYMMDGSTIATSAGVNTISNLDWVVAGRGDYDGDGSADILWRNQATGQNWVYLMNGATISASAGINTVSNLSWTIVGNGDYDGDGKSDILLRNGSTGQNWMYLMNGSTIAASAGVNTVSNLDWIVVGNGDYDGDGKSDILLRNVSTGQNWMYLMNGATIATSAGVNTVSNLAWEIVGNGDYDGDGRADILWRNQVTGQNWMYLMNGPTIATSTGVNTVSNVDWRIVGDGDYDGDGSSDILWRNQVTGQNWVYLMNGATIGTSAGINTVSNLSWQIVSGD